VTTTPPGWFPHQTDPDIEVFWDGSAWTGERRTTQEQSRPDHEPDAQASAVTSTPPETLRDAEQNESSAPAARADRDRVSPGLAFFRSVRGRWVIGGLAFLLLLVAIVVPITVDGIETQQREQAAAREAQVRAARLANDARSDALVSRDETLDEVREFLLTDLSYAPGDTVADLSDATKELESVSVTDTDAINSAVSRVKNGMTNVGKPYTWSMSCSDAAYETHEFPDFRAVWASTSPLSRCEPGSRSGTFYTETQRAALASGAISSLEGNGTLQSICAELGFGSYASMESYSTSQTKELTGALTVCPDHPAAGDVRARIDSSLAEERRLPSRRGECSGRE
jgi:hypothetical protein